MDGKVYIRTSNRDFMKNPRSDISEKSLKIREAKNWLLSSYRSCEEKWLKTETQHEAQIFFMNMLDCVLNYREEVPESVRKKFKKGTEIEDLFDECDYKRRSPGSNSPYNFGSIGS